MKQTGLAGDFLSEQTAQGESPQPAAQVKPSSASKESDKAQKRANLVLAGLFLAGMACVYMLSLHDEVTEAEPIEEARAAIVDQAVKQFDQAPPPGTGGVRGDQDLSPIERARDMIAGTARRQVPLDNLKANPFVLVPNKPLAVKAKPSDKPKGITPGASAVQKAEALDLQSIVVSNNRSMAIISDRLVTVGQEVAGWRVEEIANGRVVLKFKDLAYVLRLKQ